MSVIARDPREAKLPKWAQERFSDLRDALRRVKRDFDEYADSELPPDADAVANPNDWHPRLAARKGETVRFNTRRGALDVKIDHYDGSLEIVASEGRRLVIRPWVTNRLAVSLEED